MLKLSTQSMINIAGTIWFAVGLMLFCIGTNLFISGIHAVEEHNSMVSYYPMMNYLTQIFGRSEVAAALIFALSSCIGYFKGRFVLVKSAKRTISRLKSLQAPIALHKIYSPGYYALLLVMVGLGMSIKFLGITGELRAVIDVAIGSALLSGSLEYFRHTFACQPAAPIS